MPDGTAPRPSPPILASVAEDARRRLPSLDALLRSGPARRGAETFGRPLVKAMLAEVLSEARSSAAEGRAPDDDDVLLARAMQRTSRLATGLTPAINATGVVLHTNLGRAPLPERSVRAVIRAAGYTDLEIDRELGERRGRATRAERMLRALTAAEDAFVVNNCAAALLLVLAALAKGKQVLVSRGELIEIGGEFRIPDIMAASGARLVEVGTTNRTRLADYRSAIGERTGALLKVHPSNYRVVGFTSSVSAQQLSALASKHGVPFVYDVGSGLLASDRGMPPDEPSVSDALAAGADIVTFSGDKLLGGPQAGCIVGRTDLIGRLKRHPIARAVRVDKLQIAALEQVLRLHATGRHDELPVTRMLKESVTAIHARARRLAAVLHGDLSGARVVKTESVLGGGSTPGAVMPSWGVRLTAPDPAAFAARLRSGSPAAFGRVERDAVVFDARTVTDEEVPHLARAIQYALEGDDLGEE
jgi:L-seryl-tRNA(Ser) seleniumtransferase